MSDDEPRQEDLGQAGIIDRLAEVSAMLHEERGDRGMLVKERARLVELARKVGLLQNRPAVFAPPPRDHL